MWNEWKQSQSQTRQLAQLSDYDDKVKSKESEQKNAASFDDLETAELNMSIGSIGYFTCENSLAFYNSSVLWICVV